MAISQEQIQAALNQKVTVSEKITNATQQFPTLAAGLYGFVVTGAKRTIVDSGKREGMRAIELQLTPAKNLEEPLSSLAKQFRVNYTLALPLPKVDGTDPEEYYARFANNDLHALFGDDMPRIPERVRTDEDRQAERVARAATSEKVNDLWNGTDETGNLREDCGLRNLFVFMKVKNTAKDGKVYANPDGSLLVSPPEGTPVGTPVGVTG